MTKPKPIQPKRESKRVASSGQAAIAPRLKKQKTVPSDMALSIEKLEKIRQDGIELKKDVKQILSNDYGDDEINSMYHRPNVFLAVVGHYENHGNTVFLAISKVLGKIYVKMDQSKLGRDKKDDCINFAIQEIMESEGKFFLPSNLINDPNAKVKLFHDVEYTQVRDLDNPILRQKVQQSLKTQGDKAQFEERSHL